ncbi:MAG: hypothetical protein IJS58_02815 [Bacilli bacterium]|nr:hypothetical protein [Bacilli bacterium]
MYINDGLKDALNYLQYCMTSSSDNILLIFDTNILAGEYKKMLSKKEDDIENKIFVSLSDLLYPNCLIGRRFSHYYFITDSDIIRLREEVKNYDRE